MLPVITQSVPYYAASFVPCPASHCDIIPEVYVCDTHGGGLGIFDAATPVVAIKEGTGSSGGAFRLNKKHKAYESITARL